MMWKDIWSPAQAQERAEREARTAAGVEARKLREKSKRVAMARRMPKDVVMSDSQRRMVERVLRGIQGNVQPIGAGPSGAGGYHMSHYLFPERMTHGTICRACLLFAYGSRVTCKLYCTIATCTPSYDFPFKPVSGWLLHQGDTALIKCK
jgi:hypothetical protein